MKGKARNQTRKKVSAQVRTQRRGLASLRADLEKVELAVGRTSLPDLLGTTSRRSILRWREGEPITGIPRAYIRFLAAVAPTIDLDQWVTHRRIELTLEKLRDLEDDRGSDDEDDDGGTHEEPPIPAPTIGIKKPGGSLTVGRGAHGDSPSASIEDVDPPSATLVSMWWPGRQEHAPAVPPPVAAVKTEAPPVAAAVPARPDDLVPVRYPDGRVERVSAARAVRLLETRAAEMAGEWTEHEAGAVLGAYRARQDRAAAELQRNGQLPPYRSEVLPFDLGPMGRLAKQRGELG